MEKIMENKMDIYYLRCSNPEILHERISERGRKMEKNITP
jgi:deoxyadenosine/deoxycytidine kinase